jgi:hypothetical protein
MGNIGMFPTEIQGSHFYFRLDTKSSKTEDDSILICVFFFLPMVTYIKAISSTNVNAGFFGWKLKDNDYCKCQPIFLV